jgi:hypothetical protein
VSLATEVGHDSEKPKSLDAAMERPECGIERENSSSAEADKSVPVTVKLYLD